MMGPGATDLSTLDVHGFPSSSRMWQPLLDRLADRFRLVAPDYPGFGHSDAPSHTEFAYTFDHLAAVVGHFTQALGLTRYTLVMQDYGGPLGFRLAIAHPERLEALIVQNAVAHEDGLGPLWKTRREFWADRETHEAALRENFKFSFAATRQRHVGTSPNAENYDPDLWTDEFAFLVWGRYDPSFQVEEAEAYRRDVPGAEMHVLDAGRFALDEQPDLIADLTRRFLQRRQLA
jgi:pimeloyl-ACP methyl ester carboxylesterase